MAVCKWKYKLFNKTTKRLNMYYSRKRDLEHDPIYNDSSDIYSPLRRMIPRSPPDLASEASRHRVLQGYTDVILPGT